FKWLQGSIVLGVHVLLLWIDPIIYNRIEYSHPYLTGLSIVLGLAEFGLNGAILGPVLVCVTSWALSVIGFVLTTFATYQAVKKEECFRRTNTAKKSNSKKKIFVQCGDDTADDEMSTYRKRTDSFDHFEQKKLEF
ncbi:hypothetical protein RFI_26564, partial [Reticulomyxa filosa]